MECGRITVPLNHRNPQDPRTMTLPVVRIAALDPARRIGALFYNPGGPGGSPFGTMGDLRELMEQDRGALRQLAERFDLIGVQPRGLPGMGMTGDGGLQCWAPSTSKPFNDVTDDRSRRNLEMAEWGFLLVANATMSDPRTSFINTGQAAFDLEAVRQALDEPELNGIFISYGTWLAAYYHALFPASTGRLVLDSNMILTADMDANMIVSAPEIQAQFGHFVVDVAVANPGLYELGDTAESVAAVFGALSPKLRAAVRPHVLEGPEALRAGRFLDAYLRRIPTIAKDDLLHWLNHQVHSQNAQLQARIIEVGTEVIEQYFTPNPPLPANLTPEACVFMVVRCGDTPNNLDLAYWRSLGNRYARDYPVGGAGESLTPCIGREQSGELKMNMAAALANSKKILLVQAQYDTQTPLSNIEKIRDEIPGLNYVVAEGARTHGVIGGANTCVNYAAVAFLVNGTSSDSLGHGAITLCGEDLVNSSRRTRSTNGGQERSVGELTAAEAARISEVRARFHAAIWKINRRPDQ